MGLVHHGRREFASALVEFEITPIPVTRLMPAYSNERSSLLHPRPLVDVGVLTLTGTIPGVSASASTLTFPQLTSIAVHPSGKFVYVTNSGSDNVSMYSIEATTGALALIGTIGT